MSENSTGHSSYELASAYVSILPSLEGLSKSLKTQLDAAMPSMKKSLSNGLSGAAAGATRGLGKVFSKGGQVFAGAGRALTSSLNSGIQASGRALNEVFSASVKTVGGSLAASVAAVSGQVVAGGLTRSLGLNEAEAKLQALGFNAQKMQEVMTASANAIDGTAYAMNESVGAATQFIAAGITNSSELEAVLRNTGKLADISGRSFADMGAIMSKNASAGIVQWEDMVQLINAGVPIQSYLAKQMGKTTAEIKKMASAGEITFKDFDKAISGIDFDSALYASRNVTLAFKNVRAQLSKIGAGLWEPIIDGLGPILVRVREGLVSLQKMPFFTDFMNRIQTSLTSGMGNISKIIDNFVGIFEKGDKSSAFIGKMTENFKKFKDAISGVEGPLAGLAAALGSSFLGQLPIVGRFFGSFSAGAGLMGGALFQVYKDSDLLKGSLETLLDSGKKTLKTFDGFSQGWGKTVGDSLAGVVDSISKSLGKIDLSKIQKIDLSKIFSGIFDGVADFINTIASNAGKISDAFGGVFDAIATAFDELKPQDVSFGEWLGEAVTTGLVTAASAIEAIIPLVKTAFEAAKTVVTSDFTTGVFEWLKGAAKYFSENEGALIALGATLTTLFVGGKLLTPITALINFFGVFGKGKGKAAAGAAGSGGMIASLAASSTALLAATPAILGGVLAIAAIGAAVTAALGAFDLAGGYEILKSSLQNVYFLLTDFSVFIKDMFIQITDILSYGITSIGTALGISPDFVIALIDSISGAIATTMLAASAAMTSFVEAVSSGASLIAESFSGVLEEVGALLTTIATDGAAAGIGGFAAAGGISALAVALAGLGGASLLADLGAGLGSLWSGFTSWLTGKDTSAIGQITEAANAISGVDQTISGMPERWASISGQAFTTGFDIIFQLGEGMLVSLETVQTNLLEKITAMMQTLQAQVNSSPLVIDARVSSAGYAASAGGSNTYNSTTNFDVRVNNSSVIKSLARSAR